MPARFTPNKNNNALPTFAQMKKKNSAQNSKIRMHSKHRLERSENPAKMDK